MNRKIAHQINSLSIFIFILIRIGIGNNPPNQRNDSKHSGQSFKLSITSSLNIVEDSCLMTNIVDHITN